MKMPKNVVYMLRTSDRNRQSYGNFQWPEEGYIECDDWNPKPVCGYGLHGALWGEGEGHHFSWKASAVWQIVAIEPDEIVELSGKIKVPRGWVVFSGDRNSATQKIIELGATGTVVGATTTAGCEGTATAGYRGTAIAGDWGTATAGYKGTATAGRYGTATAGCEGTATAGRCGTATAGCEGTATAGRYGTATAADWGTATAGYRGTTTAGCEGTATAGYRGTAIAADWGTATAGDRGKATAGCEGTATAGYRGTAIVGCEGTATAGRCGIIQIKYVDNERYRIKTGYIGENGLEPDTAYRLDENNDFVKVEK